MLYHRFLTGGTLAEPGGIPDPQFALPSTVNWMHALCLLVRSQGITFGSALSSYGPVSKRTLRPEEENTIFEQLFFSAHQLSALEALREIPTKADVARIGIVTWYYGVYYAARAMIAAQDGTIQEDHTGTARAWDRQIAAGGLSLHPFDLRVSSLVESTTKSEISVLRRGSSYLLTSPPNTAHDALGACCAYLSGSADWYRWKITEQLRASKEFKSLGVDNFRTKAAQSLRNSRLANRSMGFLHQAFRYRGKANYRESLFLAYGNSVETLLKNYIDDLAAVLRGFVVMAGSFASRRIGRPTWDEYLSDVNSKRAFSLDVKALWT